MQSNSSFYVQPSAKTYTFSTDIRSRTDWEPRNWEIPQILSIQTQNEKLSELLFNGEFPWSLMLRFFTYQNFQKMKQQNKGVAGTGTLHDWTQNSRVNYLELVVDSAMTAVFLWSSSLLAPTSLSTCRPSLRKKKVGVALISHEVLNSCCIVATWQNHLWIRQVLQLFLKISREKGDAWSFWSHSLIMDFTFCNDLTNDENFLTPKSNNFNT